MEDSKEYLLDEKESLKQLQALQSSILSAIPHAVIGLKDRTIFFANYAVEKVFGWQVDEIIGKSTKMLYRSDEDYEEIGTRFYPLLEKQRSHIEDFPCRRKDGGEIICRISASVIGQEMSDKGIVVMYEDLTRSKKIENDLIESEQKYRALFENTGTAMIIIEEDTCISLANAEVQKISGYSREEIEGKMRWTDLVREEDIGTMQSYHKLRRNDPEAAPRTYESSLIDKRGNIKPISLTIALIPGTKKSIASITDITERKRTEERLRESERMYRELVQNANSIVMRWNSKGEVTFMNEFGQTFFGYPEQEILGRHVVGTIVPATESTGRDLRPLMDQIRVDPKAFERNVNENIRRDGSRVWIAWSNKAVFDQQGQITEVFSVGTDITDRKRAEEELDRYRNNLEELVKERTQQIEIVNRELEQSNIKLQELDRLKSMFIASMSHELRTPLNSIIGFTGILLQGLPGPLNDEQKKQLGMVKGSSQHLLDLITDIIDLSKIEAGKIEISLAEFDLMNVIREVAALFGPAAGRKNLSVALDGPDMLFMRSDQRRIRQVLVNLVGNAVKFTKRGEVHVAVLEKNGTVQVAVQDTGPGIQPADMNRLFQFFSQITSADMPHLEGTGLGLYLSKKLMKLLNGDITAESEFGKGSVFTMALPLRAWG
ncbi:MAG TPA: PAS domain S-box protein [Nitrospirota bacterium]|nr:PAS domain S-box protein [Nitrospirota bacterium]